MLLFVWRALTLVWVDVAGAILGGGGHGLLSRRGAVDAGLTYAAHLLRFLAPLLLYPVLSRRFGVEGVGLYVAATGLAAVTAAVVDYGVCQSGPRDVAATEGDARRALVGRTLALRVVLIMPAVLIGLSLGLLNPALRAAEAIVVGGVGLGLAQGLSVLWLFQGLRDPGPGAGLEAGGVLVGAVVVLATPELGVGGALAVQAAGLGLGVAAGTVLAVRRCRPVWARRGFVRKGLVEGLPLFAGRAAVVAYTGAMPLLAAALAGPAQAALYGVADKIVAATTSLLRPLAGLAAPRIAGLLGRDRAGAFRTARWSLIVTLSGMCGAAVGLWLAAAPLIVRLAAGPGFEGAVGTLRVLVLILPLVAASQVMGLQLMTALRMDRRFLLTVAVGGVATLTAALVLAPTSGADGMGWARVVGEAAVVLAGLACLRPHWRALFPKSEARDVPAV